MRALRVVLVEDHEVVRQGLRLLLDEQDDMEVVAEARTMDDAVRCVRGHQPDVIVLDLNLPDGIALDRLPDLRDASPSTSVVVLTMQESPTFARRALAAGAVGYVLKEAAGSDLVDAIHAVVAGCPYVTPTMGARLAREASADELPDGLTAREAEIVGLLALGHTNAEIADRLFLSRRTIETHRARVMGKLPVASRADLVRYAFAHDLVTLDGE